MGKPRTKRQLLREERKQKRKANEQANFGSNDAKRRRTDDEEAPEDEPAAKRQHQEEGGDEYTQEAQEQYYGNGEDGGQGGRPEREFFGMLADDEQEYFRRADELLELNQFPSDEEREGFLRNVYREAAGKELKLASSQSLSRLMERLILLGTTRQRKKIFTAFAGHFMTLVQHRFASHCCEALFLQSAPAVTTELGGGGASAGFVVDTEGSQADEDMDGEDGQQEPENSMENLFLLTLDEFEEHLSFLMTDRFASHTLRVLLVVLSGRPLEDSSTRSLLKSKKKENISVQGAHASDESKTQLRAVPTSFTLALKKIISDALAGMDFTALRVLVKHPTGNPLLQLLLEIDIALNHKDKKSSESTESQNTLLYQLLPDAPASFSQDDSQATDFVNSMIYDQIGSRLLETLISQAPGKIFKAMHANILGPRIGTYVRNDIASYPAIKALQRFSKDALVDAVGKILPVMPTLVTKGRYNVIKTLYERCQVRGAYEQTSAITKALTDALGSNSKELVPRLCLLGDFGKAAEEESKKQQFQQDKVNTNAMASHGAQLVATMLTTTGAPSKVAQSSLLSISADDLYELATRSMPSVTVLTTALDQPAPNNPVLHKSLVSTLVVPHAGDLAINKFGHNVLNSIITIPASGKERSVQFHVKQNIMASLGKREGELRETWMGRSVWRSWKGDMWKTRPSDWVKWAKEIGLEEDAENETGAVGKTGDGRKGYQQQQQQQPPQRKKKPWEIARDRKLEKEKAEQQQQNKPKPMKT